jgi:Flp pilus assembly protein TadD
VEWISRSLKAEPKNADAWSNLGIALTRLGRLEKAVEAYRRSLALAPKAPATLASLGGVLRALGDLDGAMSALKRAAHLAPDHAGVLANLGAVRIETGAPGIAELELRRALALKPDDGGIWCNLGSALRDLGRRDEARAAYARAVELAPNLADARQGIAYLDLADGSLENFWRAYGLRWRTSANTTAPRTFPQPLWTGEKLESKTLLIWGEQGIGDEIMFAGLIPEIASRARRCIVETDRRLVPLLARSLPDAEIVARENRPDAEMMNGAVDYQISMGDLARMLRPSLRPFRPLGTYLKVDAPRAAALREAYWRLGSGPIIGISWRSRHPRQGRRVSAPLANWGPILSRRGVIFVNLQYGRHDGEIDAAEATFGASIHRDPGIDPLTDLDGFAAQVAAMDAVVTIDNSTLPMAASLAKPVLGLLAHSADWRWLFDRADSPWFPTLKLFRQATAGDWASAIEGAAAELGKPLSG